MREDLSQELYSECRPPLLYPYFMPRRRSRLVWSYCLYCCVYGGDSIRKGVRRSICHAGIYVLESIEIRLIFCKLRHR